ncbi:bifunctional phosphoribosylaminoimidazolecarboxamide formyltransferase/IMP cyclohydrolase [Nitrococcus mobilis]|uniref:bifunctional phosphoribosylaminoimidazolecarboxamide formyltransferase/IMP cyclohydrolase n=1 Tax=Nitrococcus mobilis TaxID=35797 RepID=UPI00032323DA|nr:bifunctional phosphoribosylaminoimidazolecarboxamide formyltransferase/IMP cyclohydrolase [Nitrococcus mobilis]
MTVVPPLRSVRRALISVSDKTGVVDFANALVERGVEILSTGGTARLLSESELPVVEVSAYTGFPEIMDGRVKTLHPKVHAALLRRPGVDDALMEAHEIRPIDLLVVNLYPFEAVVAQTDCSMEEALANIDIGGVAMLRAAAKNYAAVAAVTAAADYPQVLKELDEQGGLTQVTRRRLAASAFAQTAHYDTAIAQYFMARIADDGSDELPQTLSLQLNRTHTLRYGENPHQRAAFFQSPGVRERSVASAAQLQGKRLSFNNIVDTDTALTCAREFEQPACVIVKHANPCGVAVAGSLLEAYGQAYQTDPTSAFGGIIAVNRPLDAATAAAIVGCQFVEVIIAPSVLDEALVHTAVRKNIRVLAYGPWNDESELGYDFKRVRGGFLVQECDSVLLPPGDGLRPVGRRHPSTSELEDLLFAWKVAKFVKSNAIVYARDGRTLGIGAGQMSRIDSARIGARKAADVGLGLAGSVLASDAFFPFRDAVDHAATAGVKAIIQPGGSVRDEEVIAAADEHGMAMVFAGMRHFRH